jgi:hypothetical protein
VHLPGRRRRHTIVDPNALTANALRSNADRSLTASGFRITKRDSDNMRRLIAPWQQKSFGYYDQLGEIKFAAQFYARMLAPLKLFAAEIDVETGDVVETDNQDAIDALARIQDPGGGRTGLLSTYGRLMFLTGECYLFVSLDPDTGLEQWEMLSTDELRPQSDTYVRYKAPSLAAEEYREPREDEDQEGAWVPINDREAVAYRLWQRHPRFSMLADATMMGVLELCEELLLLTQSVRARARSRLAGSGILLIDERISPPPAEAKPDEDPNSDPFIAALTRAMTLPIVNEGAASQVVPLTIRVPVPENGHVSDLMHHLQIIDPTQLYPETGLRYECIKRIAIGLDMPPEILLGMEQANHWTAWQIDEQTWKGHGAPKAIQLCDDLTSSYFRPYLRDVLKLPDWEKYLIGFDAADIINHPDRGKDALSAYNERAIGKRALRKYLGFDEGDAMPKDELAEEIGILTRDSSLAWYGTPSPRGGAVETGPGQIVDSSDPIGSGGPPEKQGGEVEKTAPQGGPPLDTDVVASAALVAKIAGAADLALLRSREAAGARVRSLAKKDAEMTALIANVKNGEVIATLGRQRCRQLKVPNERELLGDISGLIEDSLRMWNIKPEVAKVVHEHVENHAARTLYDARPSPLPATFASYLIGLIGMVGR